MIRTLYLALLAIAAAAAENLIAENSSFEAGMWGFEASPYAWVRSWPQVIQPRIVDDTAAHGRCSLRVDNGSGNDGVLIVFPAIQPGKGPVTFSFFARSSDPDVSVQARLVSGYAAVVDGDVRIGQDWKRYSVTGEVGRDLPAETRSAGRAGWYAPTIRILPALGRWKTVWIDALQVERGPTMGPYAPGRPLDASLDLSEQGRRRFLIYDLGEHPQAELRVSTTPGTPFSATWAVRDVLSGRNASEGTVAERTGADGRACIPLLLPPAERRLYQIVATVKAGDATTTALRTYGGMADRTRLPGGRFGGSIESFELGREHYLVPPDPGFRLAHWRESPEDYVTLARRLGWSWVHLYEQAGPLAMMPDKDSFYTTDPDLVVEMLRRHDLAVVGQLSGYGNYHTQYSFPAWMKTGPKSLGGESAGKGAPLIDLAAWRSWCSRAATHFKGRMLAWETWNEPGVKMRESEYLPYAEAAYQAVKNADPQAGVLGLCGTWDVGGDLYGWVKTCLKMGGGTSMDAISIHGYHTKDRDYVARVRAIASELTGRDWRIWDTECGFCTLALYGHEPHFSLTEAPQYGLASASAPTVVAESMARQTANELAHGAERLGYFNLSERWTTIGMPTMLLVNHDGSPDLGLICQNFLIETFLDAVPLPVTRREGGLVAYVFDRPQGPLLVYWQEDGDGNTACLPLAGRQARVTDLLGGKLVAAEGKESLSVPIDRCPRFLTATCSPAELEAAAADMTVPGSFPLRVGDGRMTLDREGRPALNLTVTNRTHVRQPLSLAVRSKPAWLSKTPSWTGDLPSAGGAEISLPLSIQGADGGGELRLAFDCGSQVMTRSLPLRILSTGRRDSPAIPSTAADWLSLSAITDDQGTELTFDVADDAPAQHQDCPSGALKPWQGDCVEIFLSLNRTGNRDGGRFGDGDMQLVCVPPRASQESSDVIHVLGNDVVRPAQVRYHTSRTSRGWQARLGIPWTLIETRPGCRPAAIGFTFVARDVGSDWRERRLFVWSGGNDNYCNTTRYGLLILK